MTVTRFAFKLESDANNYIDLAQCLSMVQRTMIRQKQTFTVLGGQVVDNASSTIKISTAPNFWYVRAAVNRAFKAWKDMRAKALQNADLENSNQAVGKFADFKIVLNAERPTSQNILPHFTGNSSITPIASHASDAWSTASVVDEAGAEKHFRILGAHTTNYYGALKGWLVTRPLPNEENEPDMMDHDSNSVLDYKEDFLNLLHDTEDGQPERLELLYEDNDSAPYAVRDIYGDMNDADNLQLQSLTYTSTTNPHHMIAGFKALCGLLQVNVQGGTNPILFLDVLNTPEAF